MPLLGLADRRYVLLVIDDRSGTIGTRLSCSELVADVVAAASPEEAWAALTTGRRYSAVVMGGTDPDLAEAARGAGIPIVRVPHAWPPAALAQAIEAVSAPVVQADRPLQLGPAPCPASFAKGRRSEGHLVAVCGPGGTGVSTVAAQLAAARAVGTPAPENAVLLADLARRADQAFLHRIEETSAGLLPLIQAGRCRPITAADIHRATVAVAGFRLLPGLRRPEHWTAVSRPAFDEILSRLVERFHLVVADITGDFEGEADGGSIDVEDRNHPARASARAADVVVVVGRWGTNGGRRLTQLINELLDLGVEPARIQPVVTRSDGYGLGGQTESVGPRVCGLPAATIVLTPATPRQRLAATLADRLATVGRPDRGPALVPVRPGSLGCGAP